MFEKLVISQWRYEGMPSIHLMFAQQLDNEGVYRYYKDPGCHDMTNLFDSYDKKLIPRITITME